MHRNVYAVFVNKDGDWGTANHTIEEWYTSFADAAAKEKLMLLNQHNAGGTHCVPKSTRIAVLLIGAPDQAGIVEAAIDDSIRVGPECLSEWQKLRYGWDADARHMIDQTLEALTGIFVHRTDPHGPSLWMWLN